MVKAENSELYCGVEKESFYKAFFTVIQFGLVEQYDFMMKHGASLEEFNSYDDSLPLEHAVASGQYEIARKMIGDGAKIDAYNDNEGHNALWVAVLNQDAMMVEMLLNLGASVENITVANENIVHILADMGNVSFANNLLDHVLEQNPGLLNAVSEDGQTPIHYMFSKLDAATEETLLAHRGMINYLLDKGSDIHAQDAEGLTVLHWAAWYGMSESSLRFWRWVQRLIQLPRVVKQFYILRLIQVMLLPFKNV